MGEERWSLGCVVAVSDAERHSERQRPFTSSPAGHYKLMMTLLVVILKNIWDPFIVVQIARRS